MRCPPPVKPLPPMHPNAIHATYMDYFNHGVFYMPQLSSHPISIDEWRERETKRWEEHCARSAAEGPSSPEGVKSN